MLVPISPGLYSKVITCGPGLATILASKVTLCPTSTVWNLGFCTKDGAIHSGSSMVSSGAVINETNCIYSSRRPFTPQIRLVGNQTWDNKFCLHV